MHFDLVSDAVPPMADALPKHLGTMRTPDHEAERQVEPCSTSIQVVSTNSCARQFVSVFLDQYVWCGSQQHSMQSLLQEDKHATTEVHPGPGSDISEPRSTSLSLKSTGHNRRREHKTWYSVAAVFAGAAALLVASLIARPMLPVFKLHTHEHQNTEGTPLLDLKQAALVWPASDWGADILIPARRSLSASDVPAESVNVADVSTCDIVIGYTAFDEIENAQDVLPKTSLVRTRFALKSADCAWGAPQYFVRSSPSLASWP